MSRLNIPEVPQLTGKLFSIFAGMYRTWLKHISVTGAVMLVALLVVQIVWESTASSSTSRSYSDEKVNLALRRTAHLLLTEAGDSTSKIPPVHQIESGQWLLRLEQPFSYERLPALLQESFQMHDIQEYYNVMVLRCDDGELTLGYSSREREQNKDAGEACLGREREDVCCDLKISFPDLLSEQNDFQYLKWLTALALGAAGALALQYLIRRKRKPLPETDTASAGENLIVFGKSKLDISNQTLYSGSNVHKLTYREAKLLQLFANRPNQLLERQFILENVWADEGILVGRSVDVFVSRLRKLLRDDPAVAIAAVHGVGYRLEVA